MPRIIAEKQEKDLIVRLAESEGGHIILWRIYPERPDEDLGWPIRREEIDKVIADQGLARLNGNS